MKKAGLFACWLGLGLLSSKVLSVGPGALQNDRLVLRAARTGGDCVIQGAQFFLGNVAQVGRRFVLQNAADRTMLLLDDQRTAKAFMGMSVQVTGRLDSCYNVIHVVAIQAV